MFFTVRIPDGSQRGPQYMDQVMAAVHHAIHWRDPLKLVIGRYAAHVALGFECSSRLKPVIEQQLLALYPDCEIGPSPTREPSLETSAKTDVPDSSRARLGQWTMSVRLSPDVFPLKTYRRFEDLLNRTTADPLSSLLAAVDSDGDCALPAWIDIVVRPARCRVVLGARRLVHQLHRPTFQRWRCLMLWYARGRRSASLVRRAFTRVSGWGLRLLDSSSGRGRHSEHDEHLDRAIEKLDEHLFEAAIFLSVAGPRARAKEAKQRLRTMFAALGTFSNTEFASFSGSRIRRLAGKPARGRPFLCSAAELATIWHPASEMVRTPTLATVISRQLEAPVELPLVDSERDLAVLGTTTSRGRTRPFGLLPDDRRRHLAILGKTGMGKTTLLQGLIAADIAAGCGLAVIDPHGDLAEVVQQCVPSFRTNDVILFDAADAAHPVAFIPCSALIGGNGPWWPGQSCRRSRNCMGNRGDHGWSTFSEIPCSRCWNCRMRPWVWCPGC